jgi:murein DD-endopeptidase MepM/ murein hydrolase activator NlpD
VQAGQKIGEVGYNGWSDGVHLHVEVNQGTSLWNRVTKPFRS